MFENLSIIKIKKILKFSSRFGKNAEKLTGKILSLDIDDDFLYGFHFHLKKDGYLIHRKDYLSVELLKKLDEEIKLKVNNKFTLRV